jgi:Tfp pilus assembly protein PilF
LRITDNDRGWVEESFKWLIDIYGYPGSSKSQITFTEFTFPLSFQSDKTNAELLIKDLLGLLGLQNISISVEYISDLRDITNIPFEIQGYSPETELVTKINEGEKTYSLAIYNNLLSHPPRLLHDLILEIIKIKFEVDNINYENSEETEAFLYLVAVYFNLGFLLTQGMRNSGTSISGFWERKWNYTSLVPDDLMGYALAFNSMLKMEPDLQWTEKLPSQIKQSYFSSSEYFKKTRPALFNQQELEATNLLTAADNFSDANNFDSAIESLRKALFLTNDDFMKATIYNNIGYYLLRKQEYAKSIANFQKALEIYPGFGFANDNLGFAFIMSGDLETGRHYIECALKTEKNDDGYSYRNLALYYQLKKNYLLAEEYFKMSFLSKGLPVDLLEFFFARFLFETGKEEEALKYLDLAIAKGEPEAVSFKNSFNK